MEPGIITKYEKELEPKTRSFKHVSLPIISQESGGNGSMIRRVTSLLNPVHSHNRKEVAFLCVLVKESIC